MSLHDEFEAVKHVPQELWAWVKSLIAKLEGEDRGEVVAPTGEVSVPQPAPEGTEAAHPVDEPPATPPVV